MLTATEQQFQLINRKADKLEVAMRAQMAEVKQLRSARDEATAEADGLRQRLREAEGRVQQASIDHQRAVQQLQGTAAEYSRAQLLRKRYRNTLGELQGYGKAFVVVTDGLDQQGSISVTDDCSVSLGSQGKQFVYDGVLLPASAAELSGRGAIGSGFVAAGTTAGLTTSHLASVSGSTSGARGGGGDVNGHHDLLAAHAEGLVRDVLSGINVLSFTFGPAGGGKTTAMFGAFGETSAGAAFDYQQQRSASAASASRGLQPGVEFHPPPVRSAYGNPAASFAAFDGSAASLFERPLGLVGCFLKLLFGTLEENDVTHYNMRLSMAEIYQDNVRDLQSDYADSLALGQALTGAAAEVRSVHFQTMEQALELVHVGLSRAYHRGSSALGAAGAAAGKHRTHLVLGVVVENFSTRGHFRRATATFVDFAGASAAAAMLSPDQMWVNRAMLALCDTIAMHSAASQAALAAAQSGGGERGEMVDHGSNKRSGSGGSPLPTADELQRLAKAKVPLASEAFGGNCKASLLCAVSCLRHSTDEILSALTYANHFKAVQNRPVPYDIPAELQRLQMEMGELE